MLWCVSWCVLWCRLMSRCVSACVMWSIACVMISDRLFVMVWDIVCALVSEVYVSVCTKWSRVSWYVPEYYSTRAPWCAQSCASKSVSKSEWTKMPDMGRTNVKATYYTMEWAMRKYEHCAFWHMFMVFIFLSCLFIGSKMCLVPKIVFLRLTLSEI